MTYTPPEVLADHWNSPEGQKMAAEYALLSRADLAKRYLSDFALANAVFLASRDDLDLIHWQTAAKERIRWLSVQLAKALTQSNEDGWLPISLCPKDGKWRRVKMADGRELIASCDARLGVVSPDAGSWLVKSFAYHNPSRPTGEVRGGVEVFSQAYDTHVATKMPEGEEPVYFRPNDTVLGTAKVRESQTDGRI